MKLRMRIGTISSQIEIQRTGSNQFAIAGEDGTLVDAVEVDPNTFSILINGRAFEAIVIPAPDGVLVRACGGEFHVLVSDPRAWRRERGALFGAEGEQQVTAPMPGKVIRILVSAGETVGANQGLVVVEAMKMQNEIRAPRGGVVERIFIREGDAVAVGEPLVTIR